MIDSSLNAPIKKNGAGGAYTWGTAADDPIDSMPASSEAIGANVSTIAACPVTNAFVESDPFKGDLMDDEQFPSLSGKVLARPAPAGVDVGMEQVVDMQVVHTSSAQTAVPLNAVPLNADQLRHGTQDLFDASHPRNKFACKPTSTQSNHSEGHQVAIDWSSSGIPMEVNRSLIKAGTAAHLGLYQHASINRIPAQYLRPATAAVQPSLSHRVQSQGKPQMVKQMCAKGCRGQR
jgi:hypothetical protein